MWLCKHDWKVLSETTTDSVFDNAMKTMKSTTEGKMTLPHQLCRGERKHIQIVVCNKCGALKRFVTDI